MDRKVWGKLSRGPELLLGEPKSTSEHKSCTREGKGNHAETQQFVASLVLWGLIQRNIPQLAQLGKDPEGIPNAHESVIRQ